ncbi:hypothetical protein FRC11_013250 [Ceratobasidium sp. 423]|nr:hypothetical protein FRC11_013250 [Ceratobasidium sp. 423]
MPYERRPEPGTYYIQSVAAPKSVIEVPDYNQERVVCSPRATEPQRTLKQQWYIQRSGRDYKIKNIKYGLYLASLSAQPKHGTTIGASPSRGSVDWSMLRTHDGFAIQYGDEDMSITSHYGLDVAENPLFLWNTAPQDSSKRWKFEKISDGVGGEVAETTEDRIAVLRGQLRKKDSEIAIKDQLLAQKEQELRDVLQSHRGGLLKASVTEAQLTELRNKIDDLKYLIEGNNAS